MVSCALILSDRQDPSKAQNKKQINFKFSLTYFPAKKFRDSHFQEEEKESKQKIKRVVHWRIKLKKRRRRNTCKKEEEYDIMRWPPEWKTLCFVFKGFGFGCHGLRRNTQKGLSAGLRRLPTTPTLLTMTTQPLIQILKDNDSAPSKERKKECSKLYCRVEKATGSW